MLMVPNVTEGLCMIEPAARRFESAKTSINTDPSNTVCTHQTQPDCKCEQAMNETSAKLGPVRFGYEGLQLEVGTEMRK